MRGREPVPLNQQAYQWNNDWWQVCICPVNVRLHCVSPVHITRSLVCTVVIDTVMKRSVIIDLAIYYSRHFSLRERCSSLVPYSLARTLATRLNTLLQSALSFINCSISFVDRLVHSLTSSLHALRGLPLSRVPSTILVMIHLSKLSSSFLMMCVSQISKLPCYNWIS